VADKPTPQRKRGVQASRARLTHALTAAGLKTQASLAERIAELEGLDSAPKDVVNRVFRERPVELTTLERVARALEVEAHTLYKTAGEAELPDATPGRPAPPPHHRRYGMLAVAGLILVGALLWLLASKPDPGAPAGSPALSLGVPTVVVAALPGDPDGALTERLRSALADSFQVANGSSLALVADLSPSEIAGRLRADAVVDGELVQIGRFTGVRIHLLRDGVRQQIWAESWPTAALAEQRSAIAANIARAVRAAFGMESPGVVGHFPLAPLQDNYLEGQLHLDSPSSELNVRRAASRFEAALRQDANYARAQAGLCQSLLEEHWMANEARALEDAALTCGQALQLAPDDPVVAAAHAHFLRRTGRNDDAIAKYQAVVANHPWDASALTGLASALLHEFRRTGDESSLRQARITARRAADVDPWIWKPLFALATIEWFDGNVAGAIAASEEAVARNENEFVLANLGTFYLCDGAFEQARDAYLRALELNPQSYVGNEFLGMAYYFLGEFERSAELRQQAIDAIATGAPEIHEMWGNLGDSYRRTNDTARAIDAYTRAAEIAERDHLRGNATIADRAARAYYYTILHRLDPDAVPDTVLQGIDDEIDGIAAALTAASGHRRMAETYVLRSEPQKARQALARGSATCSGYAQWPGLESLGPARG